MRQWLQTPALALLLVAVPLARGGMVAEVRAAFVAITVGLATLELLALFLSGERPRRRNRGWFVLWFAVSAWVAIQMAVSWAGFDVFGLRHESLTGSAYNLGYALTWWAVFTAWVSVAWVASRLQRVHVRVLLVVLTGLVVFEALYGLITWVNRGEFILGVAEWQRPRLENLSGTFTNRNHFASLLALCWPMLLAFPFARRHQGGIAVPGPMRYGLAVVVSIVIGMAVFSSQSRLGVAVALLGLVVYGLSWQRATAAEDADRPWWLMPVVVTVAVLSGLWLGLAPLLERYLQVTEDVSRLVVWSAALELPWQTWLFGAGPASFVDVFQTVQPAELVNRYRYMHNDWLQFVLEVGIVGTVIVGAAFLYWLRKAWPGRPGLVQCGALGGIVAVAVHAIGDFPLHIPGVAVVFWFAVGLLMNRHLVRKE